MGTWSKGDSLRTSGKCVQSSLSINNQILPRLWNITYLQGIGGMTELFPTKIGQSQYFPILSSSFCGSKTVSSKLPNGGCESIEVYNVVRTRIAVWIFIFVHILERGVMEEKRVR